MLTAIGITSGVGSMLLGAKEAGFKVLGNYEWRTYYRKRDAQGHNGFEEYFDAPIMKEWPKATDKERSIVTGRKTRIDLAMGHPECGRYSNLSFPAYGNVTPMDAVDIPLFVQTLAAIKPRFFVMDDLPRSFDVFPLSEYIKLLPEYDLFPEWISNWGYGNIQKHRNRLMMVGALKTERFAVVPGEAHNPLTVRDVIGDLKFGRKIPNHFPHVTEPHCGRGRGVSAPGSRETWGQIADWFRARQERMGRPCTSNLMYHKLDGTMAARLSLCPDAWDHTAHTLTGQNPIVHPETFLPYSIRERARIQGFPDDFVFYSEKLDSKGRWQHDHNIDLVKQTGKAMPVQWNIFIAKQIRAHIEGKKFKASGERVIRSNPYVDAQKIIFCQEVGYANQRAACQNCWMNSTCTLKRKAA